VSWIRRRPLTALAALALALRVACAAVTELHPLFPAYYYTDATMTHSNAVSALQDVQAGRSPLINGSLSERVQTSISLGVYRLFGPKPLLIKLLNAALGALAVAAFTLALFQVFPSSSALAAGLVMAAWPSHIFYTSQNLKEAPVGLFAYAALGAAFAGGCDARASRSRAAMLSLCAGAALLGAGFYRSYILVCLGSALLLAFILSAVRPPRGNALSAAAVLILALLSFPSVASRILSSYRSDYLSEADQGRITPRLIPVTYSDDSRSVGRPTSPEGITRFRNVRQASDRRWAQNNMRREIGTQIYPGAEFKTWLDVVLYLPKGAFTVLFMPLPGLSPLEGKPGRYAAAAENLILFCLAALAAAGIARSPITPARLGLLAFFAAMAAGAALLEFDLGSAGRHKLLYLPMLFPFAAEEALRLAGRRRTA
jgi:hypothetical protein